MIYRLIVDMPSLPAGSGCGPILGAVDGGGVHAVRREGRQREPRACLHERGAAPQGPEGRRENRGVCRKAADLNTQKVIAASDLNDMRAAEYLVYLERVCVHGAGTRCVHVVNV